MGYNTEFAGQFDITPRLTLDQYNELCDLNEDCTGKKRKTDAPDSYCQWRPSRDGLHLEYDGNEKFYDYEEWLRHVVDQYLRPWGIELTGSVEWRGEDFDDRGVLTVVGGKVKAIDLR